MSTNSNKLNLHFIFENKESFVLLGGIAFLKREMKKNQTEKLTKKNVENTLKY